MGYGNRRGEMEATPTWDHTYQLKLCVPSHLFCGNLLGGGSMYGAGKAVVLELE